jgi:FdrA protein
MDKIIIKKNSYFDSVSLMTISEKGKFFPGVLEIVVSMGTETNKQLLQDVGFLEAQLVEVGPNDLIIAIRAEDDMAINSAAKKIEELLTDKDIISEIAEDVKVTSLQFAFRQNPESNLAIVSVPGEYAFIEAKKALLSRKHVLLFSDNVSVEEENELKEYAVAKGLLMMGPDCGTAVINNIPLAFANVIPYGPIGIVGASGTGSQEVSSLIARAGSGITQLIGAGGRDLSEKIGGRMMLLGIDALENDVSTKVIVLISKPPAISVMEKVLIRASKCSKPVIVHFIGGDNSVIEKYRLNAAKSLEETAVKAVKLANGKIISFTIEESEIEKIANSETSRMNKNQKYIRGLYSGGTLCDESMVYLQKKFGKIYSNTPLDKKNKLQDSRISEKDTIVDLGDDEFTKGKAHPMIDPSYRKLRLLNESKDSEVAIVLLDIVIGYGSHPDPAGAMFNAIVDAKREFEKRSQYLSVVASVCGTENDPQVLSQQEAILIKAGVVCMPSNYQAVGLASAIKELLI